MNTLFFRYAIEVEQTRSISQAAENLFMAQPNLSKAIREIEDTLGFPVFRRTSKGVIPTTQGREFLIYARNIVSQLEKMEKIAQSDDSRLQSFKVSIPRASYLADGFTRFAACLDPERGMDLHVQETNSMQTVAAVASGQCDLGVIRYRPEHETYFLDYLSEKKLAYDTIWESRYLLLFSREHPLAASGSIEYERLEPYVEIVHRDEAIPYVTDVRHPSDKAGKVIRCIGVYERGSQFELLMRLPTSYMWVSPVPARLLERYELLLRRCADGAPEFKDVLIFPEGYQFTKMDRQFIDKLYESKNDVAFREYG